MHLAASDVLDAYRADLSLSGASELAGCGAAWLAFGSLLGRAITLPDARRVEYLRAGAATVADGVPSADIAGAIGAMGRNVDHGGGDLSTPLFDAAAAVATDAENASAFAVATAIIDLARELIAPGCVLLQGRLLAQQARILRKVGEADLSLAAFERVREMGRLHAEPELVALAHLGIGVVARVRGNYPSARAEFLNVLRVDGESEPLDQLRAHAHHGLLVASAVAGDFDTALKHGAMAMARAKTSDQRLELLLNLSSACYDAGQFLSALHGYLQVIAECSVLRVRIGAVGGAAVSAARLGRDDIVRSLAETADRLLARDGHEYELADMSRELSDAFRLIGVADRADHFRSEALLRAERGGFHEIVHRLSDAPAMIIEPTILTPEAESIADELASGDSRELLLAAVSSDHPDWSTR